MIKNFLLMVSLNIFSDLTLNVILSDVSYIVAITVGCVTLYRMFKKKVVRRGRPSGK